MFELARTLGETVNAMNGQIQLSRIDVASNPSIAQALQVQGAPALFGLVSGRPMPILQGLPQGDELRQVCDEVIPQLVQLAHQSGVTGTAPYADIPDDGDAAGEASEAESQVPQIPPEHAQAHLLAQNGDYEGAAAAYAKLVEADPHDELAARERSKALLLARSAKSNVRQVRAQAAAAPDDVDAQLAVADIDMIGGQIDDAFGRLLDYLASGHRDQIEPVRQRLLEYFAIPESADPRLSRARRRLATLMY
jgi:putative thioredoxin